MTFKSADSFRHFDKSVRRELRYVRTPEQEDFLKVLVATSHARALLLKEGIILWRAQIGHDWREEKQGEDSFEVPAAYSPKRMKPMPEMVSDGRANPRGIACLYLATRKETAALEVRPSIGSYVSVGQFKVLKELKLVDCSADQMGALSRWTTRNWTPEGIEKAVWSNINDAFSEPVERGDSSIDYVPTQILAETFKRSGFGGISYRSSYGRSDKEGEKRGYNVVLFDIDAADLINCGLYLIRDVSVVLSEQDNPYFVSKYYDKPNKAKSTTNAGLKAPRTSA